MYLLMVASSRLRPLSASCMIWISSSYSSQSRLILSSNSFTSSLRLSSFFLFSRFSENTDLVSFALGVSCPKITLLRVLFQSLSYSPRSVTSRLTWWFVFLSLLPCGRVLTLLVLSLLREKWFCCYCMASATSLLMREVLSVRSFLLASRMRCLSLMTLIWELSQKLATSKSLAILSDSLERALARFWESEARGPRACMNKIQCLGRDDYYYRSTMEAEQERKYVMEDIMKKRRKDQEAVANKLRNKQSLKAKRAKKQDAMKNPEKFIKQYRSAQKSYAYLRAQDRKLAHTRVGKDNASYGKLLLVIRIRGVNDISEKQKLILNKLNLKAINSAVFVRGTAANLRQLKRVENYITYGEPSPKIVKELIYKKMYAKIGDQRVLINTNELVEQHIGGDVICLEDVVGEIIKLGPNFKAITEFIYPFKLTTPPGILMSRLRKPVQEGGHWGYRGEDIDAYALNMI